QPMDSVGSTAGGHFRGGAPSVARGSTRPRYSRLARRICGTGAAAERRLVCRWFDRSAFVRESGVVRRNERNRDRTKLIRNAEIQSLRSSNAHHIAVTPRILRLRGPHLVLL